MYLFGIFFSLVFEFTQFQRNYLIDKPRPVSALRAFAELQLGGRIAMTQCGRNLDGSADGSFIQQLKQFITVYSIFRYA